jgi:L-asparagine transporter-like permease
MNSKQKSYHDIILGILLYSVVLGFFNDYTNIINTGTYSITFAVAVVMEILTYVTLLFKEFVVRKFKSIDGHKYRVVMYFSVWMVLFFSKFVFLEVIAIVFRNEVKISGFIGLLIIVLCLVIAEKIVNIVDQKLAD